MPRFIQATKHPERKAPAFLEAARAFYGDAFGARTKKDLAEAMADWGELSDEEQSFALAHLQYLNLLAQAANLRALHEVRALLDEVAEDLHEAMDAGAEVQRRDERDDEEDDDERDVFVDEGDDEGAPAVEEEPAPATPVAASEAPPAEPGGAA